MPVGGALNAASSIGFTPSVALVLAGFLLPSGHIFYIKILQSFRTLSNKKRALTMVHDVGQRVSRYLLTISMINVGLGTCVSLALAGIGMPNFFIWGIDQ